MGGLALSVLSEAGSRPPPHHRLCPIVSSASFTGAAPRGEPTCCTGADDTEVLESPSIELYTDLRAAGDKTRLILVQNMGHKFKQVGAQLINPGQQQLAKDAASFFDKTRAR